MPRYASIDIGSNSVRMLAAEVVPGSPLRILAAERQVTRLGSSVFRNGRIDLEAMEIVCASLGRMAQAYRKLDVVGLRAVATSAVRDATNQHEFLDRASDVLGTPVEIISGQEEARLIQLGVAARWPHPKQRVLILDVGGGSAEIIRSEQGRMTEAYSKPLGAIRLTEVFLKSDPPSEAELHRLDRYIAEKLDTPLERLGHERYDRLIATSASAAAVVCAINRIQRVRRDEADRRRATTAQVRKFYREICTRDLAARRKIAGVGPRRAEIIVAGAAVFLRVLESFQLPSLYYSLAGVRDGIIADLASRGVGRELSRLNREQRQVAESMARHYGVSLKHARKVAALAHQLFEALHSLHRLPPAFGKLLEASAYLHDIGHYVSDTGHHKHSHYLAMNSDMPGFTDPERHIVAALCRYHRKASPTARHAVYQSLSPEAQRAVLFLTPLLRLADNLDRGHEQHVESVACQIRNGHVALGLRCTGDASLEQWAAERSSELFRQVYGLPVSIARTRL